jgi:hypothetical protein
MGMTGHRNGTARRPARSSASAFPQVKTGAASGNRTPDLRITRTPLHHSKRATSTHATSQRTDSTPRSGQTVFVMPTVMPHRQRGSGGGAVGAHGPGGERPAARSTPPACRSLSRSPAPTGTTRCSSSRWYLVPSLPLSTGLRPVSSPLLARAAAESMTVRDQSSSPAANRGAAASRSPRIRSPARPRTRRRRCRTLRDH